MLMSILCFRPLWRIKCCPPSFHGFQQRLVATRSVDRKHETIDLAVGGNGLIHLDVYLPVASQNKLRENTILVHLPSGPYPFNHNQDAFPNVPILTRAFPETTVITLNYRLSSRDSRHDNRFPTPIHDVFTAWDYIVDSGSPHNVQNAESTESNEDPKILLHGSHIGGALALTLALTSPLQIHALAISNPMIDWPVLDEFAEATVGHSASSRRAKSRSLLSNPDFIEARSDAAQALISARTSLFRNPSGYFDSFASPVLFLRAPGRDTPLTRTAAPEDLAHKVIKAVETRYGEEEHEVGFVQQDIDAFGPYDDDYHHHVTTIVDDGDAVDIVSPETAFSSDQNIAEEESRTSTALSRTEQSTASLVQPLSDLSSYRAPVERDEIPVERPTKRRKVLRRWPPNTPSDSVLLPYVNIFLQQYSVPQPDAGRQSKPLDLTPVIFSQGAELLDLLRRACFWGREKGLAEERVRLTRLGEMACIADHVEIVESRGKAGVGSVEEDPLSAESASEIASDKSKQVSVVAWLKKMILTE